jgi:hypothetical protein
MSAKCANRVILRRRKTAALFDHLVGGEEQVRSMASTLAVLRLITNPNLLDCMTGRLAGSRL